jgi:hypothetical protein
MRAVMAAALLGAELACQAGHGHPGRRAESQYESSPPPVFESEMAIEASHRLESKLAHEWQGSWVLRDVDRPGSVQAWMVQGARVAVYDGERRDMADEAFALPSPCEIERTLSVDHGQSIVSADRFVFERDGLHVAPFPAAGGVEDRGSVWACIGNAVYTLAGSSSTCRRWTPSMGAELTGLAECEMRTMDDPPDFVLRPLGGGSVTSLTRKGAALMSPELEAALAQRMPSFAQARRFVDDLVARSPCCGAKAKSPTLVTRAPTSATHAHRHRAHVRLPVLF